MNNRSGYVTIGAITTSMPWSATEARALLVVITMLSCGTTRTTRPGSWVTGLIKPKKDDNWWRCDDDRVSYIRAEEVQYYSGGNDDHCAYVLVYTARQRWTPPGLTEDELQERVQRARAQEGEVTTASCSC